MVSIAIVAVGASLSASATAAGATYAAVAWTVAASIAASAAYAYVDQPYIMPLLFGSDKPKDQNRIGNINLPTTNPGEPRYRVYGREAYVPGHFLWIDNQKVLVTTTTNGNGKGSTSTRSVSERFADIGLACCDGPITGITAAMSNRAVFYGQRSSSNSVFTDSRVRVSEHASSLYYGLRNYSYSGVSTYGDPASWRPGVTEFRGADTPESAYLESLWGEVPRTTQLQIRVRPNFGVSESLANHFDAGDIIEIYNCGEEDDGFQTSNGGSGLRRGIYAVAFVGLDANSTYDYITVLPMAGQRVHYMTDGGTLRDWTEPDPVIIRRIDESVCGFTPDFNIPVIGRSAYSTVSESGGSLTIDRVGTSTHILNHAIRAEDAATSITGQEEVRIRLEVHGCGGGFYLAQSTSNGGNNLQFTRTERNRRCWTKMGEQRLKQGNQYELQGFCNPDGLHSNRTLTGRLSELIMAPQWGDIQPVYSNLEYVPGDRYFAWFQVVRAELELIMNELDIGASGGGYKFEGDPRTWTSLFPGNGQCTPQYTGQEGSPTVTVNAISGTFETGMVVSAGGQSAIIESLGVVTSGAQTITISSAVFPDQIGVTLTGVNTSNTATGVITSTTARQFASGNWQYGDPGLPDGGARGSEVDFSAFDPTGGGSGSISTNELVPDGLQTWPGNAENQAGIPSAKSTPYGPDRWGGADSDSKGGLGDVGFCILPPRLSAFTAPTSNTGNNIGPQGSETNLGSLDQAPLDEADGVAYRGLAHISFRDLNLYQFGNTIPQVSFKVQESGSRSVGDIVSMMVEESAPVGTVIPGLSSDTTAYGYSVAGGTPIKQALQPLSMAYGFSLQERAGQFAMLQESELPIVSVPSVKLNAREYNGASNLMQGLPLTSLDSDMMPQRVVLKYKAVATGNEESRAAGIRSPGSTPSGSRDTMEYDLKPLVMTNGYAKTRAQQLLNKSRTESTTSRTVLPPSRMDVMPGHVITTTSNNRIRVAPNGPAVSTGTYFTHDQTVGPVIPGTITVNMTLRRVIGSYAAGTFEESFTNVTLVDDGAGKFIGMPDGVELSALFNYVDYTGSGPVWLIVALDNTPVTGALALGYTIMNPEDSVVSYSFNRSRSYRAVKATLSGYDFSVVAPLVSTTHDHVVPEFQHGVTQTLKPVKGASSGSGMLFALEDPEVDGPWPSTVPAFGLGFKAPGSGGATIFESDDGIENWEPIGDIRGSALVGNIRLIESGPEKTSDGFMTRWQVSSSVDAYVDREQSITVAGLGLPADLMGERTPKQVINGLSNFMVGDEVFGATSIVEGDVPGEVVMSGLLRGLRATKHAAQQHLVGSQVTYLPRTDGMGVAHFQDPQVKSGPGNVRYLKAVQPGHSLASTPVTEVHSRALRALPSSPIVDENSLTINNTPGDANEHAIIFKWGTPSTGKVAMFQEQRLPPYDEIYEVYAFDPTEVLSSGLSEIDIDKAIIAVSKRMWNISMGNGFKELLYPGSEQAEDGFSLGDKITFQVYAISPVGRGPRAYPNFEEAKVIMTYADPGGGGDGDGDGD